jgi:putative ABC transport system substrate-binding protein
MKRKITLLTFCALLPALCASAEAQQPMRIPRVAYLTAAPLSAMTDRIDAFRQGLRELGYVEEKHCHRVAISRGKPRSYAHACS